MTVVLQRSKRALGQPFVHAPLAAVALLLLAASFGFDSYRGFVVLTLVVYAISAIGLNMPIGFSGVLSIGHGASFAVGTYASAILSGEHQLPFWVSLPAALVCGVVAGLIMAAPAARLGGLGLAMVSLGFTLILADVIRELEFITKGEAGIAGISPFVSLDSGDGHLGNQGLCTLAVVVLVLAYIAHWYFRDSGVGRAAVAAKNDPVGAKAAGISAYRMQLLTFAIGSGIGAVAGGVNAYIISYVNPSAINVDLSFLFLAMVVLGGAGSRFGPIVGAAILGGLPIWLARYPNANVIVYALVLLVIVRLRPRGLISQTAIRVGARRNAAEAAEPSEPIAVDAIGPSSDDRLPVLRCTDINKTFGGNVAVRDVSLDVFPDSIVAIVGPNGSGKTTLLNVLSGYYAPTSGTVAIGNDVAARSRWSRIVREAASRTFQTPRIFGDLSPAEHLRLATAYAIAERPVDERARFETLAGELCDELGVPMDRAERSATLSHGQARFLEIAFAISRGPRVLLLDEPATGLAASEIDLLCNTMRTVVGLGCSVVLVEHHLEMVSAIADHVVVLNLGSVLWAGAPEALASSEIVRDTYLGVTV